MRGSSLATRLFLSATAWVVVILVITGVILSSVYRNATERAFDRRLNLYLRTLIAEVATPDEPPDHQFQSLGEPLFELGDDGALRDCPRPNHLKHSRFDVRAKPDGGDGDHGTDLTDLGWGNGRDQSR